MDGRKVTKRFVDFICDCVECEYKAKGHDNFWYELKDNKETYFIADKGIEKRIQKQLLKRLGLNSKVKFEIKPSINERNAELRVKLIENIDRNFIKMEW